jgi:NAD(P)-dependent dehydrogenase (short-subunit alcohol dehydrogenase family)
MYDFSDRVALVTGGAAGLGLSTARRLAEDGAAIAIVDRNEETLAAAAADLQRTFPRVHAVVGDVASEVDVTAAVESTEKALGPIDVLVNNAGISVIKTYVEHTDDDFDRQVAVNLRGTHLFMSRVLPGMIERGRGAIVNISSVAALHYTVPHAGYSASKAAIIALTRDVAFEAARHGVRVNCVAPGLIAVQKTAGAKHYLESKDAGAGRSLDERTESRPMGWGRPEDVANTVAFLASDQARFIVGVTIPVAGGTDLWVSMSFNS